MENLGLVNIGESIIESNLTSRGKDVSGIIRRDDIRREMSNRSEADDNDCVTLNIYEEDLITIGVSPSVERNFNSQYEHCYRVNLQDDGNYIFSTSAIDGSDKLADTVITLFSQPGDELIGSDDDSGSGLYSSLTESLEGGEYSLRVESYEEGLRGEYVVEVTTASERRYLSEESILSNLATASLLNINDNRSPSFSFKGTEEHWYEFEVDNEEAGTYRIKTSMDDDTEVTEFGTDTVMTLFSYDEDRGLLQEGYDDDGGDSPYSLLNEHLSPGTYYLLVNSYFGEPGEYSISVSSVDDEARD